MAKTASARIRWLQPAEGGRAAPPKTCQYSTVAKFEEQTGEDWHKNAWSLVLHLNGTPDESWTQMAVVHFLADDATAPTDWLYPGSRFLLFEGLKAVAEGIVL